MSNEQVEIFNALKEHRKAQKKKMAEDNMAILSAEGLEITEQDNNVYRVDTKHGVVMYYASTNKWQWKGQVKHGAVAQFVAFLKKGHFV